MLTLQNINKYYPTKAGKRLILNNINLEIKPGRKTGILGRNGGGKSTLIRIISGAEQPTSGKIIRGMKVSWPLAFSGGFQGSLTGLDNIRFVCRIYGTTIKDKLDFIEEFAELGRYLFEPVKSYSSGMRARLAFALSMAIDFDCFLIDEVIAVGDTRFHEKCHNELFIKRKSRSIFIVSHNSDFIKAHCDHICVLRNGILNNFESPDEGFAFYNLHAH